MLKMGCAQIDVTPDHPVFLHGYASRNSLTSEVENPVELGVIALEQNGKKTLLVTADMLGIAAHYCQELYQIVAAEFGISYPDVIFSCSHTHFAPGFSAYAVTFKDGKEAIGLYPSNQKYYKFWIEKLKIAIRTALADMEEVTLEAAAIPVSGIAYNRRPVRKDNGLVDTHYTYPKAIAKDYTFSPIDTDFNVWKFMRANRPKAVLARYGCHPVTGGDNFYGMSPDYPGYFRRAVKRSLQCPAFFMLGTAGDVVPMRRQRTSREDLGEVLGRTIQLNELVFQNVDSFELKSASFTLPGHIVKMDGFDIANKDKFWEDAMKEYQSDQDTIKLSEASALYGIAQRYNSADFDIPIQLLKLGENVIVFLPFEVLSVIGLKLREACPEAIIVSVSGGYEGYLPIETDFPKGGYEATRGYRFAHDTGDRILASCIEAVKKFR